MLMIVMFIENCIIHRQKLVVTHGSQHFTCRDPRHELRLNSNGTVPSVYDSDHEWLTMGDGSESSRDGCE